MKKIILSFDYELFFGIKSGTVLNTLINPTNKLMDVMEECDFRGDFFIDVLMIKYLKKNIDERSKEDLKLIENQLIDMVRRGHRIELHLHPHWFDAIYNGDGTWDFKEFSHYMLSAFNESEIIEMFVEGVNYLNSVGSKVIPDYKVCAFRAGGWAIQPFHILKNAFVSAGIKIDSSSAYGVYNLLPDSHYDFRKAPQKSLYYFEDDVCKEVNNGQFIEVPISTYTISLKNFLIHLYYRKRYKYDYSVLTDGTHFRYDLKENNFLRKSRLYKLFHKNKFWIMYTFSHRNPRMINYLVRHSNLDYICFIDHPKDFTNTTIYGIRSLKGICESVNYFDLILNY